MTVIRPGGARQLVEDGRLGWYGLICATRVKYEIPNDDAVFRGDFDCIYHPPDGVEVLDGDPVVHGFCALSARALLFQKKIMGYWVW